MTPETAAKIAELKKKIEELQEKERELTAAVTTLKGEEGEQASRELKEVRSELYQKEEALAVLQEALEEENARSPGRHSNTLQGSRDSKGRKEQVATVATTAAATITAGVSNTVSLLAPLFAIAIHFWDVTNNFDVGVIHRSQMFILYGAFTLWIIFAYYKTGFTKESLQYIGISLFAWALPYLRLVPFLGRNEYFTFGLLIFPIWFLYLSIHTEPKDFALKIVHFIGQALLFFYAAILLFLLINIVVGRGLLPDVNAPAATVGRSFTRVWGDLKDIGSGAWDRMASFFNPVAWKQRLNRTFNPTAAFYAGQVEKNKNEPTGVFITKLESLYPVTYVGTDPVILGRIEAKTFLDKDLLLTPSCRLERGKKEGWAGTPDSKTLTVNYQLTSDVLCTFPVGDKIEKGSYTAILGIAFDYETWAYQTDTFISKETALQYRERGRDLNQALDIPPTAETVYTNGPVMIGMQTIDQPVIVNLDAHRPIQQRFGFTISDRWSQGHFEKFYSADVLVPEPFELDQCVPVTPNVVNETGDVRTYRFEESSSFDPSIDTRLEMRTVTCQLVINDKEGARELLSFGEKVPVTFVVKAKYKYVIEKKTRIRVEE